MKVLLVEDNRKLSSVLKDFLFAKGIKIEQAFTLKNGRERLKMESFDVVVSDIKLPDGEGLALLEEAVEEDTPLIVITAYGTISMAVDAIKKGAYNFLQKPVDPEHLEILIKRASEEKQNRLGLSVLEEIEGEVEVVGSSPAFVSALGEAKRAASSEINVLLLGETGSGKEVFAKAIHALSSRKKRSFVPINCASIPETLLESELFGYEKGAFTGAYTTKIGRIELARGGTLFLDEISEMSPSLQAKLLRVIEEKKLERLGGAREIEVDVRLIFATNRDLNKLVEEGKFREDLYYRISVFPIEIPPLRARKQDIIPLAVHFLREIAKSQGIRVPEITDKARKKLISYSWKGNVRELKNVMERAFVLSDKGRISAKDIVLRESVKGFLDISGTLEEAIEKAKNWAEKEKLTSAMKETDGDISKAASLLGISPKTLYAKLKKYNLR